MADAQTLRPLPPSITCPVCGMVSYSPADIRHGWCGNCGDYTSDPQIDAPDSAA